MSYEFILQYPPKQLSPNFRGHWSKKSKAAKQMRLDAFFITKSAMDDSEILSIKQHEKINVFIDAYPPDRRCRDIDNVIASLKSSLDGIADALQINDKRFILHPMMRDETENKIVIKLTAFLE